MTKYEREIYGIINAGESHMTAEQVYEALRGLYPGVSLATVYNNLNRLTDEGLIRRIGVEGSPDRYDRASKHDHIVCTRCGRLSDRSFADLTASLREQLGEDFVNADLSSQAVHLLGICRLTE